MKRALLVSVVKGLRGTGKPLVFEGVETPGQFEFACSLGPGYLVQGWYAGKPETISAMNIQGLKRYGARPVSATRPVSVSLSV
ncbi:diguanylate phosphodiesterase [Klebsiella grimontii]|uniref:diguanylate phosphodiesterase n=1 Tax=Klebsiella grimontii TaxID=2058152 RepID=UPI0023648086|nr:diguanylate phosphodiesterase [Klebsiella grimontii]